MSGRRGANNESVSNINRALVIQYLKKNGICTRSEISKAISLTGASITKIIASLIELGIVTEKEFTDTDIKRGNRSVGISLNAEVYKVIAVKLARRSFSVGVFDIGGGSYESMSNNVSSNDTLFEVASKIKSEISEYLSKYKDVAAIGIAVPGPYSRKNGELLLMTEMENWKNVPLKEQFEGIYDMPVFIEHDANAGALAEWWFGNQKQVLNGTLVHFLVGEGVGAGVITNGSLICGSNGIAGEIGHISIDVHGEQCSCGNFGCLEKYCSSIAFVKRARVLLPKYPMSQLNQIDVLDAKAIFKAANSGDELSLKLTEEVGTYIGYGIVTLMNAYDPNTIVISNEMAAGGEKLLNEAKRVAKERLISCLYDDVDIVLSDFSGDSVLYGAAAVATDHLLRKPNILIHGLKG